MGRALNEHLFSGNLAGIPSEEEDDLEPSTRKREVRSTLITTGGILPEVNEGESLNRNTSRVNIEIKNKPVWKP